MKVILRKEHEKLGSVGSVVDVKDGYARNYLFPRNVAYPATPGAVAALEEEKKQAGRREAKAQKSSEKIAAVLRDTSVTIKMRVGEDEKLFGAVTSQMIADELKAKGLEIDKRIINLDEPIKALGIYDVDVKLHSNVMGTVKVWVVSE